MTSDWNARLESLREDFDETFAHAIEPRGETEDFLVIRVASEAMALRLDDVARVAKTPKVVAVPTKSASVLGLVALRGALVSLHSLAALLGRSRGAHAWMALVRGAPIAVAFDATDAFVRVPRQPGVVLRTHDAVMSIVDLDAVIRSRSGH